jgi:hypothetical protein
MEFVKAMELAKRMCKAEFSDKFCNGCPMNIICNVHFEDICEQAIIETEKDL